jgi:sterol desaturase/sphingolipid hydroxylase (fatty acid hydroxylase superfamily)
MHLYVSTLETAALLMLGFYLLERFVPGESQPAGGRIFNYLYYPFLLAWVISLQYLLAPLYVRGMGVVNGGLAPHVVGPVSGVPGAVGFALVFALIWDTWQYTVHRWQHRSAFLWQTHKLHHDDAAVNSSSQGRNHLLHYAVFALMYLPMAMLFGSLAPHAVAAFLMFKFWGFALHMNVRVELGVLTPFIAGPQYHRIHHSRLPEHLDKNFATFFPVIDMVFGTYYRPARNEFPPTGLATGRPEPLSSAATFSPLLEWYRTGRKSATRVRQFRRKGTTIAG